MTHAHEPVRAPEAPFRSPWCVLGQHLRCQDSEPRDSGVPGVHYLVCICACHHPAPTVAPTTGAQDRTPAQGPLLPSFGCPERRGGDTS